MRRGIRLPLWFALAVLLVSAGCRSAGRSADSAQTETQKADYYVATNGNDVWSGKLATPNPDNTDGPFASITRARDAIRQLKAAGPLTAPVRVLVRGGTYYLKEPLRLGPEDSGTAECPVTYAAYPGEKPILSGGRVLTGWTRRQGDIWSCSLKDLGLQDLRFRQFFYRGARQTMARWPNRDPERPRTGGFLYCEPGSEGGSNPRIHYRAGAFPRPWTRLSETEVTIFPNHAWGNPSVPIAALDPERRVITLSRGVGEIWSGNRFYIQNAIEELDTPGEWYLDRQASTVHFYPPDPDLPQAGAVVPALENLVLFQGSFKDQRFVEYVTLYHLGVECCEKHGVILKGARHCGLIGCTLLQVGGSAVVVDAGSSFCRVAGNDVAYPGAHAIAMFYDTGSPDTCTDNVITNNYAHHCGEMNVCSFGWGSGICISGRRNVASHNLVHDTAYNAFNFDGWDNVIEYNSIHHSSLECDDCAGIYGWVNTKGGSGRSTVRFNRVADSIGYGRVDRQGDYQSPYSSQGIYLDDYLSETTVFGNLVYRAGYGCVMLHGGWNNTVENNILVDGALSQVTFSNMRRDDPLPSRKGLGERSPSTGKGTMCGIILRRNIMVCGRPDTPVYRTTEFEDCVVREVEGNLVWSQAAPAREQVPGTQSDDAWRLGQAAGRDMRSVIADPGFVNPKADDYRLRPDSPALKLGFKPLPLDQMGLVESPERASWPVVEPKVAREPSLPPPVPRPFDAQVARAYVPSGPVTVDGKLAPGEWGIPDGPPPLRIERLATATDACEHPSLAHVLADQDALYVAMTGPLAATGEPATMEVFLQGITDAGPGKAYVLRGDSAGKFDCSEATGVRLKRCKPLAQAVQYAASVGIGQWSAEWRIPLAACALAPANPKETRFNVRVHEEAADTWVGWATAAAPLLAEAGYLVWQPSIPANAPNLAMNGDFETGPDKPPGWSTMERIPGQKDGPSTRGVAVWVKEGRDGTHCLKLAAVDPKLMCASEIWWAQTIANPPAGTYIMSYEVRARDVVGRGDNGKFYACGWASRKRGCVPANMNLGSTADSSITQGSVPAWTRRECRFDVPSDVEMLYLLFGIKRATGSVWVDNVRLEKCLDN